MALRNTDMPLDQLREYRPVLPAPADHAEFWRSTLAESRELIRPLTRTSATTPLRTVRVEDAEFSGFGGDRIKAWILRPLTDEPAPVVIEFLGYGSGRGLPGERMSWASAGYIHVVMDTRGQGGMFGSGGDTPDPHGAGSATPGYLTRGILDPADYYYRRLFTDAALLVDEVAALDFVEADRIAVVGSSQGGALSLVAAALNPKVAAVMPDVPFLADFPRSISLTPEPPFTEITRYLAVHRDHVDAALRTLSYHDVAIHARAVTAPTLISVGLMDDIVLPSTVFAAFNAVAADDKAIEVYAYNGHEGGGTAHWHRQAAWLADRFEH